MMYGAATSFILLLIKMEHLCRLKTVTLSSIITANYLALLRAVHGVVMTIKSVSHIYLMTAVRSQHHTSSL